MSKKIAFIHYPYLPDSARLETMPFALNSVIALAKAGWQVEVHLWEQPSVNYNDLFPDNVLLKYHIDLKYRRLNKIRYTWLPFPLEWPDNYNCVFGLGQAGAYLAAKMAKASHCPFIYLNDEFPSIWTDSCWLQLEKQVAKDAAIIVVPDQYRFGPLCQELSLDPSQPHSVLPNIPLFQPIKDINWHQQLNLPQHTIPFLHAGSVSDWMQVPELLSSVPYWPENTVLVLHGRNQEETETTRKHLAHLDCPGKVFWSSQPLTVDYLNSLVAYCTASFALYRNIGPNIEYTGFSSGKLMRSLVYGRPVIASQLSSFSFVKDYQLGVLVNHPAEIPDAVKYIMQDGGAYRRRCLNFCQSQVSFEKYWHQFCNQLRQVTNVELCP